MVPLRRARCSVVALTTALTTALTLPAAAATHAEGAHAASTPAASTASCTSTSVLMLSAYPAEIKPNLDRLTLDPGQPVAVDGHQTYSGTLLGRRVVLAITGEGTKNGHDTTLALLAHLRCISAVTFSGTAGGGGHAMLGDVAVPARWTGDGGTTFELVDPGLLNGARRIAAEAAAALETTASVNVGPCGTAGPPVVYLPRTPTVVLGGTGSTDNGGNPGTCADGAGALGGCDPCPPAGAPLTPPPPALDGPARPVEVGITEVVSSEEETASAMQAATAMGVPFIAFRAVSDDALPTPLWLGEYLVYQQVAADNAALVARLWVRDWHVGGGAPLSTGTKAHAPRHRPARTAVTRPGGELAATGHGPDLPIAAAVLIVLAAGLRGLGARRAPRRRRRG